MRKKTLSTTRNITRQERNLIEKHFYAASNNLRYRWGIAALENLSRKNSCVSNNELFLCRLGLLYDHLALRCKKDKRLFYEKMAMNLYKKAKKINPDSYRATWGIGRIWWHRNNRRALQYAKEARRLAKKTRAKTSIYTQNVGLVYESLKDYKNAEKWLLRGMKENPKDWSVYINLVTFYRLSKNFQKAIKYAGKLEGLMQREPASFKKTKWWRIIKRECIENAAKPLPKKERDDF